MTLTIYQYPGCSTCRAALAWLKKARVDALSIDIVQDPPSARELGLFWRASGLPLRSFFNTSGVSYRAGNLKDRLGSMTEDEQLAALAADGKLIKRPLLVAQKAGSKTPERVLVGFNADAYAREFPRK